MIQANELRIGSNYMVGGQLITATAEDILKCRARPALRRPIELTPKVLVKCGFAEQFGEFILSKGDPYENGNFLFTIEESTIQISVLNEGSQLQYIFIPKPKYLHQLQNLYHALTCEELTYNAQ